MQCEVWSVKCEGISGKWEVWSVKCGVWSLSLECEERSVKCEVWSVRFGVWRKQWEVRSVECEVWSVECEVWSLECEECSVQCEVWSVKCGVWSVKTLLRLSLKKSNGCRGKDTVGTGCLWTIGHLCLGNFRRRLARDYVIYRYLCLTSASAEGSKAAPWERDSGNLGKIIRMELDSKQSWKVDFRRTIRCFQKQVCALRFLISSEFLLGFLIIIWPSTYQRLTECRLFFQP